MAVNKIEFIQGKKVQHAYTMETLWMLREGREQILCRTSDLREIWFYPEELVEVTEIVESRNSRFV